MNENEIVMVSSSVESSSIFDKTYINKHAGMNHVVAMARHFWHFEGIKNTNTKMTYMNQVRLGGFIPHQLINRGAVGFLSDYLVMRNQFSR